MTEQKDIVEKRSLATDIAAIATPVAIVATPVVNAWAQQHFDKPKDEPAPTEQTPED